jgi:hypothetical protein
MGRGPTLGPKRPDSQAAPHDRGQNAMPALGRTRIRVCDQSIRAPGALHDPFQRNARQTERMPPEPAAT